MGQGSRLFRWKNTAGALALIVAAGLLGGAAGAQTPPSPQEYLLALGAPTQAPPAAPAKTACSSDADFDSCPAAPVQGKTQQAFSFDDGAPARVTSPRPRRPRVAPVAKLAASRSPGAAACHLADTATDQAANLCVTFALNSASLTPQSHASLDNFAAALKSGDSHGASVVIEGYTDSRGADAVNLALSEARATSVVEYLVAHGVSAERLKAHGLGASEFIAGLASTDAANRRVEARWGG